MRTLNVHMSTRGRFQALSATGIVRIYKESDGRVSKGVPDPSNHHVMFGLMHVRHEMVQKSILFLSPLGDLTSQVIDASQKIETTDAHGVEQLHEYARSLTRKTTAIGFVDFLFLQRFGNR